MRSFYDRSSTARSYRTISTPICGKGFLLKMLLSTQEEGRVETHFGPQNAEHLHPDTEIKDGYLNSDNNNRSKGLLCRP